MLNVAGALYTVKGIMENSAVAEKSLVDQARVVQECFQFSSKSDEMRGSEKMAFQRCHRFMQSLSGCWPCNCAVKFSDTCNTSVMDWNVMSFSHHLCHLLNSHSSPHDTSQSKCWASLLSTWSTSKLLIIHRPPTTNVSRLPAGPVVD